LEHQQHTGQTATTDGIIIITEGTHSPRDKSKHGSSIVHCITCSIISLSLIITTSTDSSREIGKHNGSVIGSINVCMMLCGQL